MGTAYENAQYSGNKSLRVGTAPNPSNSNFRLQIESTNRNDLIKLQVTDLSGRIVESRKVVATNTPVIIGTGYKPGIYFVQIIQGTEKVNIKVIKQLN